MKNSLFTDRLSWRYSSFLPRYVCLKPSCGSVIPSSWCLKEELIEFTWASIDRHTKYSWWWLWIRISSKFSWDWCAATLFIESVRVVYDIAWRTLCVCRGSLSNSLWHSEVACDMLKLARWTIEQQGNTQKQQVNTNLQPDRAVQALKSFVFLWGTVCKILCFPVFIYTTVILMPR